jgi:hypothetical protein
MLLFLIPTLFSYFILTPLYSPYFRSDLKYYPKANDKNAYGSSINPKADVLPMKMIS